VAQAMREEKIFEELNQRSEPAIIAKKTPATISVVTSLPANLTASPVHMTMATNEQSHPSPVAVKSDPLPSVDNSNTSRPSAAKSPEPIPGPSSGTPVAGPSSAGMTPRGTPSMRGRGGGSSVGRPIQRQTQVQVKKFKLFYLSNFDDIISRMKFPIFSEYKSS